jgi:hypothetical protein
MSRTSAYPLRQLKSLKEEVVTKRDSINQFIAIAEKALETESFFAERANQANLDEFRAILLRQGGQAPQMGDELE